MSQTSKPTKSAKTTEQAQDSQADSRLNKRLKDMPIAIVGMASIFANSRYLNKFWDLISEKIDAITELPSTHWQPEEYYDADKSTPDKSYCKRGGFLPDVDFNPMEFGLPPNILELTDSSQLLSLIVAKEVLADANLPEGYDRDKIGITLGVGGGQKISHSLTARLQYPVLKKVFANSGISDKDSEMLIKKFQDQYVHWEENSFPGSLGNVIAGRIANRFDFGGMNCVVDAACAGSLAAMRMALTELTEGRSEMMITGGVCTDNSPSMYMSFSKTPAFTTNETIQPFDIDSKGMMIGEGIGMVALKRLEDAERDGDRIYSVIKGIGASSDGKFKSIYAPRPEGQAKALNRAYDDAGFAPHTLGLIEAHGTGTAAGDAAEFAGLCSVFRDENDTKQHIALGSVKSQIGHTKSTAGTAGLIKAALALHHKVLPPTINVSQPSPKLDIENSPFYLNTETRPWLPRVDGTPRRAGISSFGFGGTNFHFVLEEYNSEHSRTDSEKAKYRQRQVAQSFLVSASDKAALINELNTLAAIATQADFILKDAAANYPLRELEANAPRIGLVANNSEELVNQIKQAITKLESSDTSWQLPGGTSYRASAIEGKVAALFAGQGSQYLNMGRELACYYPEMRRQFVTADKVFAANDKTPLSQTLYPKPVFNKDDLKAQEAILTNTANAQSAIGAISMGQYALFTAAGFNADMVAGHSFGELSALCAAGVISADDYYKLAFARGDAMATKAEAKDGVEADAGAMYAIITKTADDLEALEATIAKFDGVKVANYNAPTQSVIAGPTATTADAAKALSELGYKAINLPVSGAFHTELVGHAQAPFAKAIDAAKFTKASRALYSNATGTLYESTAAKIKASFKKHMLQSVRFTAQLEAMYDAGARVFVEFGPKNILQKLVQGTLADKTSEVCTISINPSPKGDSDLQLKQAAVQLAVAGIQLDNIDPYQADIAAPEKKSPMSISLNAVNHISKATRAKMAKSLETGIITSQIERVVEEKVIEVEKVVEVEKIIEKVVEVEKIVEVATPVQSDSVQANSVIESGIESQIVSKDSKPSAALNIGSDALSNFFAAQQQAAQLHQQFLEIPQQYGETFTTLMTEQTKLAGSGIAIPESLQRSMEQFHQLQAQTLQSHTQFLEMQAGSNIAALNLLNGSQATYAPVIENKVVQTEVVQKDIVEQPATIAAPVQPAPVAAAPQVSHQTAPAQTAVSPVKVEATVSAQVAAPVTTTVISNSALSAETALSATKVQATMLEVVAEKTGYPTEMLELSMDMEADLGIDSIKRVEILGTVQDELPGLPELNPEDLAECRTLGEIVAYMNSKLADGSELSTSAAAAPQAAATPVANGLSADKVQATMMSVVAEKTGYPTEMLELEMDMEADLGIDSIKRVEILGTVQDELPGLPELSPEDLAECRTLGEIVAYMNSKLADGSKQSHTSAAAAPQAAATPVENGLSADKVQATMMSVVAEKTGYPTEMLELEMDMEADLGIDSIKRVEILGTVQDELPGLPELNPEDLAECRTLGEIVAYMNSKLSTSAAEGSAVSSAPAETALSSQTALIAEKVQATMMSVVAEKTGYPTEMLELSMDMEADLGIDSIKRVEILGTVQDELPGLPELSPEDLAECRTLGEIVAYMNSKLADGSKLSTSAAEGSAVSSAPAETALSAEKVQATMMSVVAEKTGYPTEMLELEMDMEADLGIDSIKRVEILGTVQDELPGLPELNPEDLAECRTLGEIVAYMNSKLADGSKLSTSAAEGSAVSSSPTETALNSQTALSAEKVQATMMSVVAEKTGYPTEMLELSMDMEADLGIDSIKRVEILGTVQDELPGLPELNPEDLAECRTLGEIVSYMNSKLADGSNLSTGAAALNVSTAVSDAVKSVAETITSSLALPPHSEVALKKLNAADKLENCFAADSTLVINDDGHNAGVLAEKLIKQGLKVAVVRLAEGQPQSPLSSDVASFELASSKESELEASITAVIAQIETQVGTIGGFIHLQPEVSVTEQAAVNLNAQSFTHVSHAFLWAKLLQPKLVQAQQVAASDARRCFVTVSRIDGGFGYLNTDALKDAELNQAALAGLTKTLSHEWPQVFCRAIDAAANLDATHLSDAITSELFDSHVQLPEVGLSLDTNGHVARATLIAGDASNKHAAASLNSSDKILVTGGAKGVTFECALALAKRTQSHFILAGRSELLAIPAWAENKQISELKPAAIAHIISTGNKPTPKQVEGLVWTVKSSIEINTALEAFAQVGASAEYVSMDVTDTSAITAALNGRSNEITGLIHGAGVLADKHIQDKTIEELARVYGTKVNGLKALLAALDSSKLKLLAMFSSAAGFYGNTGQSDYAMSNDILNKAALQFTARNPQAKVMSFNWGPWDGGMVTDALKKMFTERGVYVIPLQAGAELFATQLLSETGVQLLIGTSMQGGADANDAEGSNKAEGSSVKKLNAGEVRNASRPLAPVLLTSTTLTRALNPNAMGFIQDHRISGNPVLPTVCAIQWMREAASEMLGDQVKVLDYKLLKGIIFDSNDIQEITLELTPIETEPSAAVVNSESTASEAPKLQALISQQGRPQYKATLVSTEGNLDAASKSFAALGDAVTSANELYSNGTLFHGPRLQGIKQVFNFDDKGLLASCQLPQVSDSDCGQFVATTHIGGSQPFAEDLLLQAMLVWARLKYGAASLPSSIGEFISHKPLAFGDKGMLELEVVKTSARSLEANVALYHENGELSAMMKGAKVTISKNLNSAFLNEAAMSAEEKAMSAGESAMSASGEKS